jgi:hypothetical protein
VNRYAAALTDLGRRYAERGLVTPLDIAAVAALHSDSAQEYDALRAWLMVQVSDF